MRSLSCSQQFTTPCQSNKQWVQRLDWGMIKFKDAAPILSTAAAIIFSRTSDRLVREACE